MITKRTFFNCLAGSAIAHAIGVSGQQSSTEPRKPVDTLPGAEKNRKLKVVFVGAHVDDGFSAPATSPVMRARAMTSMFLFHTG